MAVMPKDIKDSEQWMGQRNPAPVENGLSFIPFIYRVSAILLVLQATVSPAYLPVRCSCARKPCRAKPSSAHSSSISWSDSTSPMKVEENIDQWIDQREKLQETPNI
jgi:hypothetical protein